MAASAIDTDITTVEGLATTETPNDIQHAFVTEGAVQCGFCTPGLIVAVHHLLETNSSPSEIEVKEALSGNICRCTGYGRIFSAVQLVISQREKSVS
jgi:carbon-monoxide dehydrogenase small subunit